MTATITLQCDTLDAEQGTTTGTLTSATVDLQADSLVAVQGAVTGNTQQALIELADLVQGPKGDTGETGPQGPQGIQGPRGYQGVQGVKGDDGLTTQVKVNGTTYTQESGLVDLGTFVVDVTVDGSSVLGGAGVAAIDLSGKQDALSYYTEDHDVEIAKINADTVEIRSTSSDALFYFGESTFLSYGDDSKLEFHTNAVDVTAGVFNYNGNEVVTMADLTDVQNQLNDLSDLLYNLEYNLNALEERVKALEDKDNG